MGGYEVKLPDGTILKFNTAAARDKYKALVDMFTVGHLGDVPHTNMEFGVRLSEDNPLKDGVIKPLGVSIDLKTISNRDWEEKYKGQGSGYTKKVVAVDPYSTPTPKQKTQEVPATAPLQAVLGGTPYSSAQAQPQNARYEEAAYKQNQLNAGANPNMLVTPVNSPCDVCEGVAVQWGAEVYKCADGTGPYYFSNITIDGGQQAGPFMVGKSYTCNPSYGSQPGGDCHIGNCWGPIWHVTQIIPTGQSGPGTINTQAQAHMCVDLIEDCNCVSYPYNCGGCSQPHTASQALPVIREDKTYELDNFYIKSLSSAPPTITGPDQEMSPPPGPSFDGVVQNFPFPWVWTCDVPMTTWDQGFVPSNPNVLITTYPYNVMIQNLTFVATNELLQYISINHPTTPVQNKRYCLHQSPTNPAPNNYCVETIAGSYAPHFLIYQIIQFEPLLVGTDPVTGNQSGAVNSSLLGFYYDNWQELVTALIAAGEYVGNPTDTYFDVWNGGVTVGWSSHLCTSCPAGCAPPHTII